MVTARQRESFHILPRPAHSSPGTALAGIVWPLPPPHNPVFMPCRFPVHPPQSFFHPAPALASVYHHALLCIPRLF